MTWLLSFGNGTTKFVRNFWHTAFAALVNVDDGITAFLLDFPNMHGFAFATDVEAQRAYRTGRMLSLAYSRGINTVAGLGYLSTDHAPQSDADIRKFLGNNILSAQIMNSEMDQFEFSLAYYDPVLKMPFISFRPKTANDLASSLARTSQASTAAGNY